jgi:hypothetical protein
MVEEDVSSRKEELYSSVKLVPYSRHVDGRRVEPPPFSISMRYNYMDCYKIEPKYKAIMKVMVTISKGIEGLSYSNCLIIFMSFYSNSSAVPADTWYMCVQLLDHVEYPKGNQSSWRSVAEGVPEACSHQHRYFCSRS